MLASLSDRKGGWFAVAQTDVHALERGQTWWRKGLLITGNRAGVVPGGCHLVA
jgi:hypothetical protein